MQDLVIDWSKAPEGATHYQPERNKLHHPVWLKIEGGTVLRVGHIGSDEWSFEYSPDSQPCLDLSRAIPRPAPSWSGEGLPPVGVVCEANFVGEWKRFEMRYYGEAYVVFKTAFEVQRARYDFDTCGVKFRPIRTPEQIAAEEREAAIGVVWSRYLQPVLAPAQEAQVKTALGLIYDDFYRKEKK